MRRLAAWLALGGAAACGIYRPPATALPPPIPDPAARPLAAGLAAFLGANPDLGAPPSLRYLVETRGGDAGQQWLVLLGPPAAAETAGDAVLEVTAVGPFAGPGETVPVTTSAQARTEARYLAAGADALARAVWTQPPATGAAAAAAACFADEDGPPGIGFLAVLSWIATVLQPEPLADLVKPCLQQWSSIDLLRTALHWDPANEAASLGRVVGFQRAAMVRRPDGRGGWIHTLPVDVVVGGTHVVRIVVETFAATAAETASHGVRRLTLQHPAEPCRQLSISLLPPAAPAPARAPRRGRTTR